MSYIVISGPFARQSDGIFLEGGEQAALDRATQHVTHLTAWVKLIAENEQKFRDQGFVYCWWCSF